MGCLTNTFGMPLLRSSHGMPYEYLRNAFTQVFSWDALRIPLECFGGNLSRIVGLDESYFVWDMKS